MNLNDYDYLIKFKCPNCDNTLKYYKGVENYTDFIGCPNRDNCNFRNTSAEVAITIYRRIISKNLKN